MNSDILSGKKKPSGKIKMVPVVGKKVRKAAKAK
jgi:hypothetical protein